MSRPYGGEADLRLIMGFLSSVTSAGPAGAYWHPSRVTLEAYRRLRTAPGYDPRLDLVAVAPDGTFGSYCICWFDPGSRTGLFEPLGTSTMYRRKGLGKSVMHEGLRRLRELGAHTAFVTAVHDNEAARSLYESVGFQTVNRERLYGKQH
jgi:mycothiol synthase